MTSIFTSEISISNIEEISNRTDVEYLMRDVLDNQCLLCDAFIKLAEQLKRIYQVKFTYRISLWSYPVSAGETCNDRNWYVQVTAIPSDKTMKNFAVDGTYRECYGRCSAIFDAECLVTKFAEKGIHVEFDRNKVNEAGYDP